VSALRRRRVLHAWGGSSAGVAALLIDQKLPSEPMNLGLASCASLAVGRARPQTSAKHASCFGPAVRRQQESLAPAIANVRTEWRRPGQEPQVRPPARTEAVANTVGLAAVVGCTSWADLWLVVRRRPPPSLILIIEWSAMDRARTSSPDFLTSDAGRTDEPGPRIPLR